MEIKKVMVIGAGQMGGGIAQVCAQAGYDVKLNDIKEESYEKGLAVIAKNLSRNVEKGRMTEEEKTAVLGRITKSLDLQDAHDVDIVIEAAIENMEIKKSIFAKLDGIAPAARNPGDEYIIPSDYGNRGSNKASGKCHRHALHEPGACHETR